MTRSDRPPLTKAAILGAVDRHGLTLERGHWKWLNSACAGGVYAIACRPELAKAPRFGVDEVCVSIGSDAIVRGLMRGFEGMERDWVRWLFSSSYRHAYRLGREVWQEAERRAKASAAPPMAVDDGRRDSEPTELSSEPAMAGVGADDFDLADHWRIYPGGG
jgi:hypothetical protein